MAPAINIGPMLNQMSAMTRWWKIVKPKTTTTPVTAPNQVGGTAHVCVPLPLVAIPVTTLVRQRGRSAGLLRWGETTVPSRIRVTHTHAGPYQRVATPAATSPDAVVGSSRRCSLQAVTAIHRSSAPAKIRWATPA
jgi:hypothetical protein